MKIRAAPFRMQHQIGFTIIGTLATSRTATGSNIGDIMDAIALAIGV